jgi:hypothetical protein
MFSIFTGNLSGRRPNPAAIEAAQPRPLTAVESLAVEAVRRLGEGEFLDRLMRAAPHQPLSVESVAGHMARRRGEADALTRILLADALSADAVADLRRQIREGRAAG